jgi:DNA replicative helicase MCM subunit Mcm2 (Cdc46/Mcm family)
MNWDFEVAAAKAVKSYDITFSLPQPPCIEVSKLAKSDPKIYEYFLENPVEAKYILDDLIKQEVMDKQGIEIEMVAYIIPDSFPITTIKEFTPSHKNKLVKFNGYFASMTMPILETKYSFKCPSCGTINHVAPKSKESYVHCYECNQRRYIDDLNQSTTSYRYIFISENNPEDVVQEEMKLKLPLPCKTNQQLSNLNKLFARFISVNAILKFEFDKKTKENIHLHRYVLEIIGFNNVSQEIPTKSQINEFKRFAKEPNIVECLSEHIFTGIYGHHLVKQAVLLAAIGCAFTSKDIPRRILMNHYALYGNPGEGKSELGRILAQYIDNAIYSGSAAVSAVGLGAGIKKTPTGEMVLSSGLITKAKDGVFIADEIGEWDEEILLSLANWMTSGIFEVNKIIQAKYIIHANSLLIGNPEKDVFDTNVSFQKQIVLPPKIKDRIDCILIQNTPYKTTDKEEMMQFAVHVMKGKPKEPKCNVLEDSFVKAFIRYVRKQPNPSISDECFEHISKKWILLRELVSQGNIYRNGSLTREEEDNLSGNKKVQTRTLFSILKLALAVSRLKLKASLDLEDIDFANNLLVEASYKPLFEIYGTINTEEVTTDKIEDSPTNTRELCDYILKRLYEEKEGIQFQDLLVKVVSDFGLSEKVLNDALSYLSKSGEIFEPRNNLFRRMG